MVSSYKDTTRQMFSPLPSKSKSQRSTNTRGSPAGSNKATNSTLRSSPRPAIKPSSPAASYQDSPLRIATPKGYRSTKTAVSSTPRESCNSKTLSSPLPPDPEPDAAIDENFSYEILHTSFVQTSYLRMMLRHAAETEKEKAEKDLLRLWQLVYDAEEEEAAITGKYCALSKIIKTHCSLRSLVVHVF